MVQRVQTPPPAPMVAPPALIPAIKTKGRLFSCMTVAKVLGAATLLTCASAIFLSIASRISNSNREPMSSRDLDSNVGRLDTLNNSLVALGDSIIPSSRLNSLDPTLNSLDTACSSTPNLLPYKLMEELGNSMGEAQKSTKEYVVIKKLQKKIADSYESIEKECEIRSGYSITPPTTVLVDNYNNSCPHVRLVYQEKTVCTFAGNGSSEGEIQYFCNDESIFSKKWDVYLKDGKPVDANGILLIVPILPAS